MDGKHMEVLRRRCGYHYGEVIEAVGTAGGFCVWWKKEVQSQLVAKGSFGFIFSIGPEGPSQWKLGCIYGTPYRADKAAFWQQVTDLLVHEESPWCILGDLNVVFNEDEKVGGCFQASDAAACLEFCSATGALDLRSSRNFFTWEGHRANDSFVRERLDRALENADWCLKFPRASINCLPISASDHSPILLDVNPLAERLPVPFRFLEAWCRDPSCRSVVEEVWSGEVSGYSSHKVQVKLGACRSHLALWNKQHFRCDTNLLFRLQESLSELQNQAPNSSNTAAEAQVQAQIWEIKERLDSMWRQRSRELWVKDGDRNTKFFHATTIIRRRRNHIERIVGDGGVVLQSRDEIGRFLNQSFEEVYQKSVRNFPRDLEGLCEKQISDEENAALCNIPTALEVRKCVFEMHPLKAPGPDGMSGIFYRQFWDVVGTDVVEFVQDFFRTGKFVKAINRTFIALIPKRKEALEFDHFRPISLCNFLYKVISRILASRLKGLLDRLVSPFQAAFVPGRWIAESTILTQEVLHAIRGKRRGNGLLGIKIDMSKAYDRVDWDFLQAVLTNMGFSHHFTKLVMKCVSSVTFSILLNGSPLPDFKPRSGLRQGDPLSPYLFILCSEVFSRMLMKEQVGGGLFGVKVSKEMPAISHVMFADDTFLFGRANLTDVGTLSRCMRKYEVVGAEDKCPEIWHRFFSFGTTGDKRAGTTGAWDRCCATG